MSPFRTNKQLTMKHVVSTFIARNDLSSCKHISFTILRLTATIWKSWHGAREFRGSALHAGQCKRSAWDNVLNTKATYNMTFRACCSLHLRIIPLQKSLIARIQSKQQQAIGDTFSAPCKPSVCIRQNHRKQMEASRGEAQEAAAARCVL